jgi:hypothetical protein
MPPGSVAAISRPRVTASRKASSGREHAGLNRRGQLAEAVAGDQGRHDAASTPQRGEGKAQRQQRWLGQLGLPAQTRRAVGGEQQHRQGCIGEVGRHAGEHRLMTVDVGAEAGIGGIKLAAGAELANALAGEQEGNARRLRTPGRRCLVATRQQGLAQPGSVAPDHGQPVREVRTTNRRRGDVVRHCDSVVGQALRVPLQQLLQPVGRTGRQCEQMQRSR